MLETGLRACDMWNLTKTNLPSGNFVHIINAPISKRAQEIVAALSYRLFHWTDRQSSREQGEIDQRVGVRNELRICFDGDRKEGCIRVIKKFVDQRASGCIHSIIRLLCRNWLITLPYLASKT